MKNNRAIKIIRSAGLFLLIIILLQCFISCGKNEELSTDEIKTIVSPLIELSYNVNDIFYGDGLPYSDTEKQNAEMYLESNSGNENAYYCLVSEDAECQSIDELKALASNVYSTGLCESIFKTAFEGVSVDSQLLSYAKYMENEMDMLTVRYGLENEKYTTGRTYDIDSLTVTEQRKNRITVSVNSESKGEETVVNLIIVKEENGWRLDTPTY